MKNSCKLVYKSDYISIPSFSDIIEYGKKKFDPNFEESIHGAEKSSSRFKYRGPNMMRKIAIHEVRNLENTKDFKWLFFYNDVLNILSKQYFNGHDFILPNVFGLIVADMLLRDEIFENVEPKYIYGLDDEREKFPEIGNERYYPELDLERSKIDWFSDDYNFIGENSSKSFLVFSD